ncbi:amino acid transporter AVT3B-like [Miscanthus floridulus]|uniref:amino acid transporter AVT3B-like n=1 Tax=Miscanthus floridulus TaxID=154761 RepID=UPI00345809F1
MGFGMGDNGASSSSSRLDPAPLLPRHGSGSREAGLSSQPKTFANVFIAVVGAGVLGLPYTFSHTGWAAGTLLLFSVAALTFYCMMLLVACRRRLADEHPKIASFGDLGDAVFGAHGRFAVDVMLVLSQVSFCVGYLIFISNTMAHLYPITAPSSSALLSPKALVIWAMLPFQLGLNSIKTLTLLAPLSIFADVVDLGAMGVVLGQEVAAWLAKPVPVAAFGGPAALLYGLGVSVYAFEGVGMVLPLEAEAANKRKFGVTLGLSMAFIAVMYGLFGVMGYVAFGDATRDIITTNLGAGWLSAAVQLGLCINLFFTMPVMMNPVYEVAERLLHGKRYCWWLRWLLVIVVGLTAMYVPNFTDFLALVGSSVCVLLGFVLPATFHLKVFGTEMEWPGVVSDVLLVVIGLSLAVFGTYTSLLHIFHSSSA